MENTNPDLYDTEFENVYDIDFAVLDDAVLEETTGIEADATSVAPKVGGVALSNEILDAVKEALSDPSDIDSVEFYEIPTALIDLANKTVSDVLQRSKKRVIPGAKFAETAFWGQRVPKKEFTDFRNALGLDPRLQYIGHGEYLVVSGEASEPYWPDEDPQIDQECITTLLESMILVMGDEPRNQFSESQILGIAKTQSGDYLTHAEVNELLALIASHPQIRPLENGKFSVRKEPKGEPNTSEGNQRIVSLDFDKEPEVREKPMTDEEVNETLNKIGKSSELKRTREQAKRVANPRRHGKNYKRKSKTRLKGRIHGKKQSIEQLIAKMNEASSPPK